jgi:hypothetical protein
MTSAIRRDHWLQHKPTTIYQLTDRMHNGHIARVPVHETTATVSAWLADVGAHSPFGLTTLPARCATVIGRQHMPSANAYPLMSPSPVDSRCHPGTHPEGTFADLRVTFVTTPTYRTAAGLKAT